MRVFFSSSASPERKLAHRRFDPRHYAASFTGVYLLALSLVNRDLPPIDFSATTSRPLALDYFCAILNVVQAASDLPVEISLLLFQAMKADGFIDSHHLHRRYLSSCSCVCKFWAREIREAIFRRIALRSHKDFQRLAHILSTSPSSIASYVKELEIYESRDSTTSAQAIAYLLREHLHSIRSIERRLLDTSNGKSCRLFIGRGKSIHWT